MASPSQNTDINNADMSSTLSRELLAERGNDAGRRGKASESSQTTYLGITHQF